MGDELYPVWSVQDDANGMEYEAPEGDVARWRRVMADFAAVQAEMDRVVNPRCPECNHPQFRHQQFAPGWDEELADGTVVRGWGCLNWSTDPETGRSRKCHCKHGVPADSDRTIVKEK